MYIYRHMYINMFHPMMRCLFDASNICLKFKIKLGFEIENIKRKLKWKIENKKRRSRYGRLQSPFGPLLHLRVAWPITSPRGRLCVDFTNRARVANFTFRVGTRRRPHPASHTNIGRRCVGPLLIPLITNPWAFERVRSRRPMIVKSC